MQQESHKVLAQKCICVHLEDHEYDVWKTIVWLCNRAKRRWVLASRNRFNDIKPWRSLKTRHTTLVLQETFYYFKYTKELRTTNTYSLASMININGTKSPIWLHELQLEQKHTNRKKQRPERQSIFCLICNHILRISISSRSHSCKFYLNHDWQA